MALDIVGAVRDECGAFFLLRTTFVLPDELAIGAFMLLTEAGRESGERDLGFLRVGWTLFSRRLDLACKRRAVAVLMAWTVTNGMNWTSLELDETRI